MAPADRYLHLFIILPYPLFEIIVMGYFKNMAGTRFALDIVINLQRLTGFIGKSFIEVVFQLILLSQRCIFQRINQVKKISSTIFVPTPRPQKPFKAIHTATTIKISISNNHRSGKPFANFSRPISLPLPGLSIAFCCDFSGER